MNIDTFTKAQRWYLNGYVALYLWDQDRLAIAGAGATFAVFLYPALVLKSILGGNVGGAAAFVFLGASFFLFSRFIGMWVINPLCGLYELERARRKYGPQTRRKILEWVVDQGGRLAKKRLDIAELAHSLGEGK